MSDREKCHRIIDTFSEEQLIRVAALLESVKVLADESADDAYCMRLYDDYQSSEDKGAPVSLESFSKDLGVSLS